MGIANGGFDNEGVGIGVAESWTLHAYTSVEVVARFGDVGYEPFNWATSAADLFVDPLLWVALSFNLVPALAETFGIGWDVDIYLHELIDGVSELADFGDGTVEAFEGGWSNDSEYARVFDHQPHATWETSPETWTIPYGRLFDVDVGRDTHVFDDPETAAAESFEAESWPTLDQL